MMGWMTYEWRLLTRSPLALTALLLLLLLSALATVSGMREISRQQQEISRLAQLQLEDLKLQAQRYASYEHAEVGWLGYMVWLNTWDPPSPMAFSALGLRDTAPWVLRVRALALQSQLHEGESFNPELALSGRFDFAFVLVYLAPLFLITLLHDVVSSERQSHRLATLLALPRAGTSGQRLWLRRASLRTLLALVCLTLPAIIGAILRMAPAGALLNLVWIAGSYLLFWCGLVLWVATGPGTSTRHATVLMGIWVLLTLVLPTAGNAVMNRSIPVRQGVDMMLAQHQITHASWDGDRNAIMQQFFARYPQYRQDALSTDGFRWTFYYAFQYMADARVSSQVDAYRHQVLHRQHWNDRLGWFLPTVGVQAALHRQAGTDLPAHLAYQDAITDLHTRMRHFYYPYLYAEPPAAFDAEDFAKFPQFVPSEHPMQIPQSALLALALMALLALLSGVAAARKVRLYP